MSDLKAKLAALKKLHVTVEKPAPATATATEVKKEAKTIAPTKKVSSDLGNLLVQANNLNDKVVAHLARQEEKGLYNLSDTEELKGFDSDEFITTLKNLDAATVEKSPDIQRFSRMIRKNLEQYPELTHILTDEQLGIICSGVLTLANVSTAPKTKAAATKSAKKKLEDLGNMGVDELFGM